MGLTMSEMTTDREPRDKCFDALIFLPSLLGARARSRANGSVLQSVTPPQSFDEDEISKSQRSADESEPHTTAPSIPESRSSSGMHSIGKMLDDRGVPHDEFVLIDPRCIHDPVGRAMAQEAPAWERPTKRPKAIYPSGARKVPRLKGESLVGCCRHLVGETEPRIWRSDDPCLHHDPALHSMKRRRDGESGSAFQVKRNLFIPISDSDGEDSYSGELRSPLDSSSVPRLSLIQIPVMPSTGRDNGSLPKLPKITLKPRKPSSTHLRPRYNHHGSPGG